jgi:hypothetical protein
MLFVGCDKQVFSVPPYVFNVAHFPVEFGIVAGNCHWPATCCHCCTTCVDSQLSGLHHSDQQAVETNPTFYQHLSDDTMTLHFTDSCQVT